MLNFGGCITSVLFYDQSQCSVVRTDFFMGICFACLAWLRLWTITEQTQGRGPWFLLNRKMVGTFRSSRTYVPASFHPKGAVFLALRMVVFISGPLVTSSSMKFPPRNRKNPGRTFFGGNSHPDFASSGCKWAPEGGEIGLLSLGSEARANNRRNGILQQRELIDLSGPEEESRKLRKKWSCKL